VNEEARGRRIFYLDFIRVTSLVLIVLYHFNIQVRAQAPTVPVVASMTVFRQMMGDLGVTLFIIISGAALGLSTKVWKGPADFYRKRILAIYPSFWVAYVVAAVVLFALMGAWPGSGPKWKLLLTVTGFDGFFFYLGPNYYLVGEWFLGFIVCLYLLFPLIRLGLTRKPILTGFIVGALIAILLRSPDVIHMQSDRNPLMRLPEFMFGVCAVHFSSRARACFGIVAIGMLALFSVWQPPIRILFYGMLLGPAVYCALAWIVGAFSFPRSISSGVSLAAKYSFLAFLVHHWVIYILLPRFDVEAMSHSKLVLTFILVIVISFTIAAILAPVVRLVTSALSLHQLNRRTS